MNEKQTIEREEESESVLDTEKRTRSKKSDKSMYKLLSETKQPPERGGLVEGSVITIDKSFVYINLAPFGTGIIYGREFINARDMIKNMNVGDEVSATVIETENEEGYIELSLREARQAIVWSEAEAILKNRTAIELTVKEANKGGLIVDWQGIEGFLPASQLKTEHYPRVEGGDKDKILDELKKLVGTTLSVTIIAADPKEDKLIFSEKGPEQKEREVIVSKYEVGDEVDGEVTGIVDFGVFIKVEEGLEGLAHISELDWGLVEDPRNLFTVGEKIRARVIEIKDNKISLSIKALKENPWKGAEEKFKKGDSVEAVIIKYNKHGALASVEEGVAGLVHVSEFESTDELREELELGKTYTFYINVFDSKEQKMTLLFKKPLDSSEPTEEESGDEKAKEESTQNE